MNAVILTLGISALILFLGSRAIGLFYATYLGWHVERQRQLHGKAAQEKASLEMLTIFAKGTLLFPDKFLRMMIGKHMSSFGIDYNTAKDLGLALKEHRPKLVRDSAREISGK